MTSGKPPTATQNLDSPSPKHGALGFRIIGVTKLATALLLIAAGFGILRTMNRDVGDVLEPYIMKLHLDPDNRLIHETLTRVGGIDKPHLKAIGIGTFFYAALYLVEGTGLILVKRWAEYLTVVATGSLLPLEIYEIALKTTALRLFIFAVNVAIVVYLVVKIRQQHKARALEGRVSGK